MKIIVLLKQVVDTVEELEIAEDGCALARDSLRYIINETDDHALEEALILKERYGGKVTAAILDGEGVDEILYTAFAKGTDRVVKIRGGGSDINSTHLAQIFTSFLKAHKEGIDSETIILTGSQANNDLQGDVVTYLSEFLGLPSLNVITAIKLVDGMRRVGVVKEFTGGLRGEYELPLPCILGIQSAEKPPRYVPVAKVRAASKSAKIEVFQGSEAQEWAKIHISKMFKPQRTARAQMLLGTPEEIASKFVEILASKGLILK